MQAATSNDGEGGERREEKDEARKEVGEKNVEDVDKGEVEDVHEEPDDLDEDPFVCDITGSYMTYLPSLFNGP